MKNEISEYQRANEELQKKIAEIEEGNKVLRESEERYHVVSTITSDYFYSMSIPPQGPMSVDWIGGAFQRITGYTEKDIRDLDKWLSIINPDDLPSIEQTTKAILSNKPSEFEYRIRTKFGEERWLLDHSHPVWDDKQQRVVSVIGAVQDITKRKKAEEAMKSERQRLFSLLDGLPAYVYLQAPDYSIRFANRYFIEHFGNPEGRLCHKVLWDREEPCKVCPTFRVLDTKEFQVWEWAQAPDGRIYQIYDYPFIDSDGSLLVMELGIDITERKKAEEELRKYRDSLEGEIQKRTNVIKELNAFNENIVHSMEEGILIENKDGLITFANPRMLKMLGCSKDDLLTKHYIEIFLSDFERKLKDENIKLKNGEKTRFEAALDLGGVEKHVIVSASPLMEGDRYTGCLKVFVDITERKLAEDRLREKALRYRVEKGHSYLVTEKALDRGLDVFKDLVQAGYDGMIISRTPSEELSEKFDGDIKILWLSEGVGGGSIIPPQPNLVKKVVEDFASRNSVVLLDRLDYLIVQNGFNKVLKLLNKLNEKIYLTRSVLIVVVDPDTLSKQELSLLENEIKQVETKYRIDLDRNIRDILEFIKIENSNGRAPTHKDVMKAFNITQPTATKKLKELKTLELLIDKKKGRFKTLELTEKGKEVL